LNGLNSRVSVCDGPEAVHLGTARMRRDERGRDPVLPEVGTQLRPSPEAPGGYRLLAGDQIRDSSVSGNAQEMGVSTLDLRKLAVASPETAMCKKCKRCWTGSLKAVRAKLGASPIWRKNYSRAWRDARASCAIGQVKHDDVLSMMKP